MFRFILPIVLILFTISLYANYIGPGLGKIDALDKDIEKANNALAVQKKEIEDELAKLKSHKDHIDPEDIEKLNRLVPQRNDFDGAGFVNDVNNIAIKHGMVIDNVQLSSQSSVADVANSMVGDYGIFQMHFSVESTYEKFVEFMKDIEQNEQLIDVNITSFKMENSGNCIYQVSLVTYWLK